MLLLVLEIGFIFINKGYIMNSFIYTILMVLIISNSPLYAFRLIVENNSGYKMRVEYNYSNPNLEGRESFKKVLQPTSAKYPVKDFLITENIADPKGITNLKFSIYSPENFAPVDITKTINQLKVADSLNQDAILSLDYSKISGDKSFARIIPALKNNAEIGVQILNDLKKQNMLSATNALPGLYNNPGSTNPKHVLGLADDTLYASILAAYRRLKDIWNIDYFKKNYPEYVTIVTQINETLNKAFDSYKNQK